MAENTIFFFVYKFAQLLRGTSKKLQLVLYFVVKIFTAWIRMSNQLYLYGKLTQDYVQIKHAIASPFVIN